MRKITPEEMREPDVVLTIHRDQLDELPAEIRDELVCSDLRYLKGGRIQLTVAAYQWREIERLMRGLSPEETSRDSYDFLRLRTPRLFAEVVRRTTAGQTAAEIVALFPRANATARRRIRECAEYVRVETALRDKG